MKTLLSALALVFVAFSPASATVDATVLAVGSGASPQTTGTITPVSGQLVIVWTTNSLNNFNTMTGTNGFNVTWTTLQGQGANPGSIQFDRGVPSSGTAGTITVTGAGATVSYVVVTYSGVDQTTNQGVRQSAKTFNNGSVTSLAVTLAAFGSPNNATIYGALTDGGATTFSANANYTATQTQTIGTKTVGIALRMNGQDTSPNGGTFGAAGAIVAIAAELVAIVKPLIRVPQ